MTDVTDPAETGENIRRVRAGLRAEISLMAAQARKLPPFHPARAQLEYGLADLVSQLQEAEQAMGARLPPRASALQRRAELATAVQPPILQRKKARGLGYHLARLFALQSGMVGAAGAGIRPPAAPQPPRPAAEPIPGLRPAATVATPTGQPRPARAKTPKPPRQPLFQLAPLVAATRNFAAGLKPPKITLPKLKPPQIALPRIELPKAALLRARQAISGLKPAGQKAAAFTIAKAHDLRRRLAHLIAQLVEAARKLAARITLPKLPQRAAMLRSLHAAAETVRKGLRSRQIDHID
jgi:hypothetical protein